MPTLFTTKRVLVPDRELLWFPLPAKSKEVRPDNSRLVLNLPLMEAHREQEFK